MFNLCAGICNVCALDDGANVKAARAEEELHTTPKLTNQLFEDSHNASFVSVVS